MTRTSLLATSSVFATLTGITAALAADVVIPRVVPLNPPAVSAPNAKIGVFGGQIDGSSGLGLEGALSIPIGQQLGLQVDGLAGSAGGANFYGLGGHLFWRDPRQGLVGAYASRVDWRPVGALVNQFGVEGELYRGAFTLSGILAAQTGSFTGIAGSATAAYYVQENLRLDAGYRFLQGVGSIGTFGVEWHHQNTGLSVFATGSFGASSYQTLLVGAKFYTGPQKSLIRRNREDDPTLPEVLNLFHLPPACVSRSRDGCLTPAPP